MSLIHDIRTTIDKTGRTVTQTVTDATPVLAAVGVTDLAVEKARELGERAAARRGSVELDPQVVRARATALAGSVQTSAKELPALTLNRGLEIAADSQKAYADLASRGKTLVERVRTQKATQDLVKQAESTVSLGKGAVTTVRRSAGDLQRSALATITTGRRETAKTIDAVTDTIVDDTTEAVEDIAADVKQTVTASAKRTRTAAKKTGTTAKKSTAATKRASKATATSARKTATRTRKATAKTASKVGD